LSVRVVLLDGTDRFDPAGTFLSFGTDRDGQLDDGDAAVAFDGRASWVTAYGYKPPVVGPQTLGLAWPAAQPRSAV
jgi:hypothetical protein